MSLYISSINSGSNGNCYYVGNDNEAILVDVGISCREVEKRIMKSGLKLQNVKAVFVSHEHGDHIKGLPVFLKKYPIPLYISNETYKRCGFNLPPSQVHFFKEDIVVQIGDLQILPFTKQHDAADPFSFTVTFNQVIVGVITDIGIACENVIKHFKQCNAAFLESNYDEEMLEKGSYPYHLKNRIRDGKGHISNRQALDLFLQYRPYFMSHLLLAHLSNNNNCPELVSELFTKHAGDVEIIIAGRYAETKVFQINATGEVAIREIPKKVKPTQLQFLFD